MRDWQTIDDNEDKQTTYMLQCKVDTHMLHALCLELHASNAIRKCFGATKLSMRKLCFHFSFFSNFNECVNTKHFENEGRIYQKCVN